MQVILKRKTHQTILKAKRTFCFSRGQKFVLFFWFVLQRQYFEPNLKCSIFTQSWLDLQVEWVLKWLYVANIKNSAIFIPRAGWIWSCLSIDTRRLDATFNRLHILCKLTTHAFVCYVAPYIGCTFRHIFNEVLRMSTDYLPFQMRYNIRCKGLCKLSGTTKSSRQFWKQNVLVTFPVDESWFIFLICLAEYILWTKFEIFKIYAVQF